MYVVRASEPSRHSPTAEVVRRCYLPMKNWRATAAAVIPGARTAPPAPAQRKETARWTPNDSPVHSFDNLLEIPSTLCRNTCRISQDTGDVTFQQLTALPPLQARAFQLPGL
jgi:hypothetical protein